MGKNEKLQHINNWINLAEKGNIHYKYYTSKKGDVRLEFATPFPISSISFSKLFYHDLLKLQNNGSITINKKTKD